MGQGESESEARFRADQSPGSGLLDDVPDANGVGRLGLGGQENFALLTKYIANKQHTDIL